MGGKENGEAMEMDDIEDMTDGGKWLVYSDTLIEIALKMLIFIVGSNPMNLHFNHSINTSFGEGVMPHVNSATQTSGGWVTVVEDKSN